MVWDGLEIRLSLGLHELYLQDQRLRPVLDLLGGSSIRGDMSSTITLFEILTVAAALVGIYFKMQTEVGKLKGRIAMLEKQELQVMGMLEKLMNSVDELKILFAQKGMK